MNFEVGDLVLTHLRKEIFQRKDSNKLKMNQIGHCKILRKFSANANELDLPTSIGISPFFNMTNLYPYPVGDKDSTTTNVDCDEDNKQQWIKQMPMEKTLEV